MIEHGPAELAIACMRWDVDRIDATEREYGPRVRQSCERMRQESYAFILYAAEDEL
jgi:hypothetical protein